MFLHRVLLALALRADLEIVAGGGPEERRDGAGRVQVEGDEGDELVGRRGRARPAAPRRPGRPSGLWSVGHCGALLRLDGSRRSNPASTPGFDLLILAGSSDAADGAGLRPESLLSGRLVIRGVGGVRDVHFFPKLFEEISGDRRDVLGTLQVLYEDGAHQLTIRQVDVQRLRYGAPRRQREGQAELVTLLMR